MTPTVGVAPPSFQVSDLVADAERNVAGLADQKRALAAALVRHMQAARHGRNHPPMNMVILGQTGGGKTYLTRSMLEASGLPFIEVNCTQYSEVGYHGADLPWMFYGFIDKYVESKPREAIPWFERWGVVVLDEFDKWRVITNPKERQPQRALQAELLKIVEGDYVVAKKKDGEQGWTFRTHNILYIACGAFDGLVQQPGSVSTPSVKNHMTLDPTDLISYGFIPELVGRFPRLMPLPHLDASAMIRIFEEHVWPRYQLEAQDCGFELVIEPAALTEIAQQAIQKRVGARAFPVVLEKILAQPWALAQPGDTVVVTVASVTGAGRAALVHAHAH